MAFQEFRRTPRQEGRIRVIEDVENDRRVRSLNRVRPSWNQCGEVHRSHEMARGVAFRPECRTGHFFTRPGRPAHAPVPGSLCAVKAKRVRFLTIEWTPG